MKRMVRGRMVRQDCYEKRNIVRETWSGKEKPFKDFHAKDYQRKTCHRKEYQGIPFEEFLSRNDLSGKRTAKEKVVRERIVKVKFCKERMGWERIVREGIVRKAINCPNLNESSRREGMPGSRQNHRDRKIKYDTTTCPRDLFLKVQ